MKYHILHDFRTFTKIKEKSSAHFEHIYKLKLLTNLSANMPSFPGGVPSYMLNAWFIIPPGNDIRLTLKFVKSSNLCLKFCDFTNTLRNFAKSIFAHIFAKSE